MAAATIIAAQSCDMKQSVDFIGHNGVVYTVDSAFTIVEAFAVKDGVRVFLDASLQRFDTVYPAAGSPNSAAKLTLKELETLSQCCHWIDVCK